MTGITLRSWDKPAYRAAMLTDYAQGKGGYFSDQYLTSGELKPFAPDLACAVYANPRSEGSSVVADAFEFIPDQKSWLAIASALKVWHEKNNQGKLEEQWAQTASEGDFFPELRSQGLLIAGLMLSGQRAQLVYHQAFTQPSAISYLPKDFATYTKHRLLKC